MPATTDVLTDVLETVRVGAACYGRLEASAPWGISVEADEQDAKFHVVLSGECWLEVDGQEPVHLHGGDLVALPHGHAHALRDTPSSPIRPLSELITVSGKCQPSITTGGDGAPATLVTGSFHFEDRRNNPLLSVLPPVIVLPGELSRSVHWLEPTLKFIACEAQSGRPGAQTVVSRLADVLFIQIVRGYLATLPTGASGWLGALGDAQIGAALGFIHQSPELDWTVQSLAAKVAMSRSAFASRFARLVGEPPAGLRHSLAHAESRRSLAPKQRHAGRHRRARRLRLGGRLQQSLQTRSRYRSGRLPACCEGQ